MKSMTGYANGNLKLTDLNISFELKCLNGRFLTSNISLPDKMSLLEEDFLKLINSKIKRGVFFVKVTSWGGKNKKKITYNYDAIAENINTLQNFIGLASLKQLSLSDITQIFNPFEVIEEDFLSESDKAEVLKKFSSLLDDLSKYREYEGERLKADLLKRSEKVKKIVDLLENKISESENKITENLNKKIAFLFKNKEIDKSRLSQELVYLINKHDFSEEVSRLYSHTELFEETLQLSESIGRKLDFILQEMNREANTIASKVRFKEITSLIIELKTEIEKMKEQVQNVE